MTRILLGALQNCYISCPATRGREANSMRYPLMDHVLQNDRPQGPCDEPPHKEGEARATGAAEDRPAQASAPSLLQNAIQPPTTDDALRARIGRIRVRVADSTPVNPASLAAVEDGEWAVVARDGITVACRALRREDARLFALAALDLTALCDALEQRLPTPVTDVWLGNTPGHDDAQREARAASPARLAGEPS